MISMVLGVPFVSRAGRLDPAQLDTPTLTALRGAVSVPGSTARLSAAFARVRAGSPLVLAAVGASNVANFGGVNGTAQSSFGLSSQDEGIANCCQGCIKPGWLSTFFDYLRDELLPPGDHMFANCGKSGCMTSCILECTASRVPASADIVLVDGASFSEPNSSHEVLLRRLLQLPRRPAVILLHFHTWCAASSRLLAKRENPDQGVARELHRNGSCYDVAGLREAFVLGDERERPLDELATHCDPLLYMFRTWDPHRCADRRADPVCSPRSCALSDGLPAISLRCALTPLLGVTGKSRAGRHGDTLVFDPSTMTKDGFHPETLNPKNGVQSYQGLVAMTLAVYFHEQPGALSHVPIPALPGPLHSLSRWGRDHGDRSESCFSWDGEEVPSALKPLATSHGWNLTAFDRNDGPGLSHCEESLASATTRCEQFRQRNDCPQPKRGLTSFSPGSAASFALPAGPHSTAIGVLGVRFLSSYEGMGVAHISCTGGCVCVTTHLDAHRSSAMKQRQVSVWETRRVPTSRTKPRGTAAIRVRVSHTQRYSCLHRQGRTSSSWVGCRSRGLPSNHQTDSWSYYTV